MRVIVTCVYPFVDENPPGGGDERRCSRIVGGGRWWSMPYGKIEYRRFMFQAMSMKVKELTLYRLRGVWEGIVGLATRYCSEMRASQNNAISHVDWKVRPGFAAEKTSVERGHSERPA